MQYKQIKIKYIEGPKQREEVKEILLTPLHITTPIKNQNNNKSISSNMKKKLKKGSIINETKINTIKLNVLPVNIT